MKEYSSPLLRFYLKGSFKLHLIVPKSYSIGIVGNFFELCFILQTIFRIFFRMCTSNEKNLIMHNKTIIVYFLNNGHTKRLLNYERNLLILNALKTRHS